MTELTKQLKANGRAVAAILSGMIGLVVMGIINFATEASADFNTWVHSVGKLWVPSAQGIGPYSGKETFLLIGWLGSWPILYFALRQKNVNLKIASIIFAVGMIVATLLIYTPLIDFVLGK